MGPGAFTLVINCASWRRGVETAFRVKWRVRPWALTVTLVISLYC